MRLPVGSDRAVRLLFLLWLTAVALTTVMMPSGCAGPATEDAIKAVERGDKYAVDGNHKKAIAAYSKALKIDPNCRKAWLCRAMSYNEMGEARKAVKDFTRAIELDSSDSYPYEQRARIYRTVLHDEARAAADDNKAESIRQQRWTDLQKLKGKKKKKKR